MAQLFPTLCLSRRLNTPFFALSCQQFQLLLPILLDHLKRSQMGSIVLTDSLKKLLTETAFQLKGAVKRKFMAQTVVKLGFGGQRLAEQELGWNRYTADFM